MSKNRGHKAVVGRCSCGTKLRAKDKECRRCRKVTGAGIEANLRKAVASSMPAFVAKSAGRGGAGVAWCSRGHANRAGANVCSTCTDLMPGVVVPPVGLVGKSALATQYWAREAGSSPDPALRELYEQARYGQTGGAA